MVQKNNNLNFWLNEEDLKTPKHDKMILWTFNNVEEILKELNLYPNGKISLYLSEPQKPYYYDDYKLNPTEWISYRKNKYYNFLKENGDKVNDEIEDIKRYEQFIIENNKLKEEWDKNTKELIKKNTQVNFEKTMEYPLRGYNGFNLGFIDLLVKSKIEYNCPPIRVDFDKEKGYVREEYKFIYAFEIKPIVKSIGEVLRQFQFYKSNLPKETILILVTSTKGLNEIFQSQGFYVVEYKEVENGEKNK